ncbi:hypothetical protein JCGZ_10943 [Jatropha curcas]|uniref:Glycosyltransferase n=1 Tax=Jatropha curcas TaxID=180498 RepID=A0A067KFU3_JATCU|nr:UDP-glycosyltransferase 88F3 [Jatropha curcas]KDP35101.1 hypothetical protein JCGZ_10943 [Jatropha curcas]
MKHTIVLYPYPGIGHIFSMVELGKLILHHYNNHFSIAILLITSDLWDNPTLISYIKDISKTHSSISFRRFPPSSVDTTAPRSRLAMNFECVLINRPYVLDSLQEISKETKICAFIIDLFCASALSIGKDLKIPTYYYFTSGAGCLAAYLYFPRIHEEHTQSFKDLVDTVLQIPGISPLKAIHMSEPMLDRNDSIYNDMVYFCSHLAKSDGILVNTFNVLDPKAIKAIENGACVFDAPTPPIYCIGPLISKGSGNNREEECFSWLDKQPKKSVVFLCFGSVGSFCVQQMKEIANGLETSGKRFLWVVKNPINDAKKKRIETKQDFDLDSVLPQGFLNRIKDRGLVVKSWVPQVEVLSHESVGGFVTHCGWNSVLESVVAGVPMVAWPLYAEQHLNRNILVEDMKMAIAVEQRDEDGFVRADELARRVLELMDSEKGEELREMSLKMKEKSLSVWTECGSSVRTLTKLIDLWKQS